MSQRDPLSPVALVPFVSAGEPYLRADGKGVEVVPLSLFRLTDGGACLRVGNNAYFFDAAGRYDGPEAGVLPEHAGTPQHPSAVVAALLRALDEGRANRGKAPVEAYFGDESSAREDEEAVWPKGDGGRS